MPNTKSNSPSSGALISSSAVHQRLNQVRKQLLREFIGLEHIIERLADIFSAWLLAPQWQLRPRVINLWGMTGTGKSSLIQRFIQLLDLQNQTCQLSMAKEMPFQILQTFLNRLDSRKEHRPSPVVVLDEFQMACRNGNFDSLSDDRIDEAGQIFQWMDTGIWDEDSHLLPSENSLQEAFALYEECRKAGVRTKSGFVQYGMDHYARIMNYDYVFRDSDGTDAAVMPWFVQGPLMDMICYYEKVEEIEDRILLMERMESMTDDEVYNWIVELMGRTEIIHKHPVTDALVFVIGNLDKAFQSEYFDADTSPDVLHHHTLHLPISNVQDNLLQLFRKEWVARLGSEHIIFPCLSEAQLRSFVEQELMKEQKRIKQHGQLDFSLHPSIADLIYREGVQADLGIRMLQQSIQNILIAQVPRILSLAHSLQSVNGIGLAYSDGEFKVELKHRTGDVSWHHIPLHLPRRNEIQRLSLSDMSCVAVHECGHALLHYLITAEHPASLSCISLKAERAGILLLIDKQSKVRTAQSVLDRISILYGGMVAEELLFGHELRTTGSQDDLRRATAHAVSYVQTMGVGSFDYTIMPEKPMEISKMQSLPYRQRQAQKETAELLQMAKERALTLLSSNLDILKRFARKLVECKTMKQEEVEGFIDELNVKNVTFSENCDFHLKLFK